MRFTTMTKVQNVYNNNRYMVHLQSTSLPPFFGTKKECEEAQAICEAKVEELWASASVEDKKDWLDRIPVELLIRFKANTSAEELRMLGL